MRLTLWRDDATLARPVEAAAQRHEARPRLLLRVEHDGVIGHGEIGVQPAALLGDPSVDDVVEELRARLLPQLVVSTAREKAAPEWTRVVRWISGRPASRFGAALVEMALLDLSLRAASTSLAARWPARFDTPTLATVSLLDDAEWSVDPRAARLRVKTRPGALSPGALERLARAGRPVLLDFNASARSADEVLEQVARVSGVATVAAVEQPFAPGNVADHAALAPRLGVAISLDEGVRGAPDVDQIARAGAALMICVKPARVGGLATARTLIARAADRGLAAYLGGFFESAFARGVHAILARSSTDEPSDLTLVARADYSGPEALEVPDGLGVAPAPELLDRLVPLVTLA